MTSDTTGVQPAYVVALTMRAAGADDAAIAAALDIEPESVAALLEVAAAKVARPRSVGPPPNPPGAERLNRPG